MLYLIRYPNAYGDDVTLKVCEGKPEARGLLLRLSRLLESDAGYIEEITENERCLHCGDYRTNIIRSGKLHICEVT